MLNNAGLVSECSGENIFVGLGDVVYTPPTSAGALKGITQDTVAVLAKDMGINIAVGEMSRSEIDLYIADEIFVVGTAAEVSAVNSVDDRAIPCPGPATKAIAEAYAEVVRGKNPTLVHKTNVLTFSGDLWERTFNEVADEYAGVETAYNHVDAACIYFVDDPQRYDVIVTDNLFGDILTDLGGAVSGGIGFAASANLHPGRVSMFEPVHGSAPDIAGTGKANPTAAILSGALMLDHLGEDQAAERIRKACNNPDSLSGSTTEIGDVIAARL